MSNNEVKIFNRGNLHPSKWLEVKRMTIEGFPEEIKTLYYSRPDKGNDLLSINQEPPFYTQENRKVLGSEEIPHLLLERIKKGNWWVELEEGQKYIPVYQYCPNKWVFVAYVAIPNEYEDVKALYYSQPDENDLLSVTDVPSFYHLENNRVIGSELLSHLFLSRISKAGWWGSYTAPKLSEESISNIFHAFLHSF